MLEVAAGVLRDASGAVLLAQRPAHKSYAGSWEFPGGKLEAGESAETALKRELAEELGVTVRHCLPLMTLVHDYPEFCVLLRVFEVTEYAGEVSACEGQSLSWYPADALDGVHLLAADQPIVHALQLPDVYVFTPPGYQPEQVLSGCEALPAAALLRLRLPALNDDAYASLARTLCARLGARRVVLDRQPALAASLRCGWHMRDLPGAAAEADIALRGAWGVIASVHDAAGISRARKSGTMACVLGPVQPTATHPGNPGIGWERFRTLAEAAALPTYAIGGLAPAHAHLSRTFGARGVAGISAFWPV